MVTIFILHIIVLTVILSLINEIALLLLVSLESVDFDLEVRGEALERFRWSQRGRRQG